MGSAIKTIRISISGAGRMGQAIAARIDQNEQFELAGIWSRGGKLGALVADSDVVIDFSLPAGTAEVLQAVARHRTPLVCGVTGLDVSQMQAMTCVADAVPIVYDRNMSQGIAFLSAAIERLAGALGKEYSVRIDETHHVHKKDVTSGTAIQLAQAVAAARGVEWTEIPIASERRGDVAGDHRVRFASPTETLTLSHSVTTRDVFADGALHAAAWLAAGHAPQLYSMQDVLLAV